jgi:hypothetical protein
MKHEWRDEFFAGTHNYDLYIDGKKQMYSWYSAEELGNGKQRIKVNGVEVGSHQEARNIILEKLNIKV